MSVDSIENKKDEAVTSNVNEAVVAQPKSDENLTQNSNENKASDDSSKEDPNWKAFREARKRDRLEREAAERRASEKEQEIAALKAAMEAAFAKENRHSHTPVHQNTYYTEQEEETEDQRIEKKVQAIIDAREAQASRERVERERQEYPQKLQKIYPDFKQTVASDHLDYLEYHYPEVAEPLRHLPDGFDKWSAIYKAVKRFVPNIADSKRDAARADENSLKPKSMSTMNSTPAGQQGSAKLSDDRKAANWERMQRLLKGVS